MDTMGCTGNLKRRKLMKIKIKKLHDDAVIPEYKTEGSVGMDLHALTGLGGSVVLYTGETRMFPTGLGVAIPEGYEGQVRSRSGLAKKGIVVSNSPGTIDQDYRGDVGVLLTNTSNRAWVIKHHDRIAQLVICPVVKAEWEITTDLEETARGSDGFGSSGYGV